MLIRIVLVIAVLVLPLLNVVAQEETTPVPARDHGDEARAAKLDIEVLTGVLQFRISRSVAESASAIVGSKH